MNEPKNSYEVLLRDLKDETAELISLMDRYDLDILGVETPADGWDVADSINHLTYFDRALITAISDPDKFNVEREDLIRGGTDFATQLMRKLAKDKVLEAFREARAQLIEHLSKVDPKVRVPWYGPDMSAMSAASARLMETFAHGLDIYDALGQQKVFTDRIAHICFLGWSTISFSFAVNGQAPPTQGFYLELDLPSGAKFTKGDIEAPNQISGSAIDYALVVTQRRIAATTDLSIVGDQALTYIKYAQAFAGPPSSVDESRRRLDKA